MIHLSRNGLQVALAALFVLRTLWIPAHVALEPHDHAPRGGGIAFEMAADHGHRHGTVVHSHDREQSKREGDRSEQPPHRPHPATDHKLDPVAPQARVIACPQPMAISGAVPAAVFDLELCRAPSRRAVTAPEGRSPPPRPPTRAPPSS